MGTASETLGSISLTMMLKTVNDSKTVTPEKTLSKIKWEHTINLGTQERTIYTQ